MTCTYRCGDACFHDAPNTSDNPTFAEVLGAVSRRGALKATAVVALAAGTPIALAAPASAEPG
ncbi:twin-arginine translocation signal domain-containing protein, partial [Amycolatopsis azurea]|uniref:twin-arginine translocation signal domain-containing protein n=1 Tax=Amycolatopsis azurea TaxID=36819 RepID=UPI001FD734AC